MCIHPDTVLHILQTSCYDCHSNHTDYPWYVNVNPAGLWLRNHILDGKEAINFSDLSGFTKKKLVHRFGDIAETVEKREMPLWSYSLIHRYAVLDSSQVHILKNLGGFDTKRNRVPAIISSSFYPLSNP